MGPEKIGLIGFYCVLGSTVSHPSSGKAFLKFMQGLVSVGWKWLCNSVADKPRLESGERGRWSDL